MVNTARGRRDSIGGSPRGEVVGEIDTRAPFRSVKAAVSLFGETITSPRPKSASLKKAKSQDEGVLEKEAEYHSTQKEHAKLRNAETAPPTKAALPELEKATKTLQDLKDKIKAVTASKQSIIRETEALKIRAKELEEAKSGKTDTNLGSLQQKHNAAAAAELHAAKQELSSLRSDFDSAKTNVVNMKEEAQKEAKAQSEKLIKISREIESMKETRSHVEISTREMAREKAMISVEKDAKDQARRAAKEELEGMITDLRREGESEEGGIEAMEVKLGEINREIEVVREKVEEAKAALPEEERNACCEINTAREGFRKVEEEKVKLQDVVEGLRMELEKVGREMAETKEKEAQTVCLTSRLQGELRERKVELEAAIGSEGNGKRSLSEMKGRLEKIMLGAKQAKREAEEVNRRVEEMKGEIRAAEEKEREMEMALKEAEEAQEAERKAQDELKAISERNEEDSASKDGKKELLNEEYIVLRERAYESEKMAEAKVVAAMAEVEALKAGKDEAEKKLTETLKESEEVDKAIEEAFKQAEEVEAARHRMTNELKKLQKEQ